MKIIVLVQSFPPKWLAGTELATFNIAKHLAARGHEVHVLTSFDKGLPKESKDQGFWVHRSPFPNIRVLGIVIFWLQLLVTIKKINPDITHVQGIGMGIPAFLSKTFWRIPYIVWGQGSDVYLPWRFKKPISKIVLSTAGAVIALTINMQQEMLKTCKRQIMIIPNGIDLDKFNGLNRENARSEMRIPNDDIIVTFVGTLRPVKGVKYLIQAMDLIHKKNADIKLMLVGDGPDRQELERMTEELELKDVVVFVGKVPNEKIPMYMTASDIFILPSLSEGFPIVNLEAMASGLPVIVTKVGGLPEIVNEGENGFLVEPKNPEQLADKILMLMEDNNLRYKISENNKKKAKDFSWENVIDQLGGVFIEISDKS